MQEEKRGYPHGTQEAGRPDSDAVQGARRESLNMHAAPQKPESAPPPAEEGGIFLDDTAL